MAKLKLKKYPKKPKQSASLSTMEKYLDRVKAVDRDNSEIKKKNKKAEDLKKKIANMRNS